MTNHVHLLITPHLEQSLGKAIQLLGRYYVQYYNHCYRYIDILWEGRYKETFIDSEAYLLTCMRYIELNPVRTCVVIRPV
jgi:putative transposase